MSLKKVIENTNSLIGLANAVENIQAKPIGCSGGRRFESNEMVDNKTITGTIALKDLVKKLITLCNSNYDAGSIKNILAKIRVLNNQSNDLLANKIQNACMPCFIRLMTYLKRLFGNCFYNWKQKLAEFEATHFSLKTAAMEQVGLGAAGPRQVPPTTATTAISIQPAPLFQTAHQDSLSSLGAHSEPTTPKNHTLLQVQQPPQPLPPATPIPAKPARVYPAAAKQRPLVPLFYPAVATLPSDAVQAPVQSRATEARNNQFFQGLKKELTANLPTISIDFKIKPADMSGKDFVTGLIQILKEIGAVSLNECLKKDLSKSSDVGVVLEVKAVSTADYRLFLKVLSENKIPNLFRINFGNWINRQTHLTVEDIPMLLDVIKTQKLLITTKCLFLGVHESFYKLAEPLYNANKEALEKQYDTELDDSKALMALIFDRYKASQIEV